MLSKYASIQHETDRNAQQRRVRELWDDLNTFVRERNGLLTSLPGAFPAILECRLDALLPSELALATSRIEGRRYGFNVRHRDEAETGGPVERIFPVGHVETIERMSSEHAAPRSVAHASFARVDTFEITLRSA
jgi:hypothetical protein